MKIAGFIFIALGALFVLDVVLTLVLPDGRDARLPFIANTWAPISCKFLYSYRCCVVGIRQK